MTIKNFDTLILLTWIGISAMFYKMIIPKDCFFYDEADYMFAVSRGMYVNYTDDNAIPFLTFLKSGIEQGFQKQKSSSLSDFIRMSDDITFYRHYHGPLYFYGLITSRYFVNVDEQSSRWISSFFLIASIIVVYIGCLYLAKENARVAAVIGSVMLMCSPSNIITAAQISPHGIYTLTSIITLFFIATLLRTNDIRYWYYAIVAIAVSFTAIEYAPLLLIILIICVFVRRKKLFVNWSTWDYRKLPVISALLFIGTIFTVWPGAWIKLSLVKNYLFFAYLIFAREGEFGTRTFWDIWRQRLINFNFEYIIIIPVIAITLTNLKRYILYLPFLLYGILMIIVTFRNTSPLPTYTSSLLPPFYILTGLILAEYMKYLKKLLKISISIVITTIFFTNTYIYFSINQSKIGQSTPLRDLVDYFHAHNLREKTILIDRRLLPTLHYYFPHKHFSSYLGDVEEIMFLLQKPQSSLYEGIIYLGEKDQELEKTLRQSFAVQSEVIAAIPSSERRITYHRIAAVHP